MEVRVRQASGLKHCKNIRRIAKRIWKKNNYHYGEWDGCLKAALQQHREKVYESRKNREKLHEKIKADNEQYLSQTKFKRAYIGHVGCF